jgi:hypothetical protein
MDQINTLENTNINIDIDNNIFTVSLFQCSLFLCSNVLYTALLLMSSLWTSDLPVGVFDLNTLEYFQHSET